MWVALTRGLGPPTESKGESELNADVYLFLPLDDRWEVTIYLTIHPSYPPRVRAWDPQSVS